MNPEKNAADYAVRIVPLIEQLLVSRGFTDYLRPVIQGKIEKIENTILNDDNLELKDYQRLKAERSALKDVLQTIEKDLHNNKKLLKSEL